MTLADRTLADRDEASFTFLLHGASEAGVIGNWAQGVFLPPEIFAELLKSLMAEWQDAGCAPSAASTAGAVALAAYRGK